MRTTPDPRGQAAQGNVTLPTRLPWRSPGWGRGSDTKGPGKQMGREMTTGRAQGPAPGTPDGVAVSRDCTLAAAHHLANTRPESHVRPSSNSSFLLRAVAEHHYGLSLRQCTSPHKSSHLGTLWTS